MAGGLRRPAAQHYANVRWIRAGSAGYWLLDSWEWLPPPLTEAQVAAIHRHLVASTN